MRVWLSITVQDGEIDAAMFATEQEAIWSARCIGECADLRGDITDDMSNEKALKVMRHRLGINTLIEEYETDGMLQ